MATTPINPFPAWYTGQEPGVNRYATLPTPASMKENSLWGLPLTSYLTGQSVSDNALQSYIDQATSELEHTLDLYITPVTFEEKHDYNRHLQFWSFGYMKVDHSPILSVEKFQLTFNNGVGGTPFIDVPTEFIHVQPQEGTIQLVPANGVSMNGFVASLYSGLGYHAMTSSGISNWPGGIYVKYSCGFAPGQVPAVIAGLIENMAAYKMLSILGPVLFPHNSVSIGIDGTSQSVGTLGPAFLQNRLSDLEKIIDKQMESVKSYYQKRFLIDFV